MGKINVPDLLANAKVISFLPRARDFLDDFDFPEDLVIEAVRHPSEIRWDPMVAEANYPILLLRRGDLSISVSLMDLNEPHVMYIHLHHPEENKHSQGAKSTGGGGGGKTPHSPAEIQAWFRRNGCKLSNAASGVKVTYEGHQVGIIHLTPHTRGNSPKSSFSALLRSLRSIQSKIAQQKILDTRAD